KHVESGSVFILNDIIQNCKYIISIRKIPLSFLSILGRGAQRRAADRLGAQRGADGRHVADPW
ncbi:hypothetical protein MXD63_36620, partial [Frankia sp. Cpl3]|nr:hypothetical protein [Frankia sp. Cpl3]